MGKEVIKMMDAEKLKKMVEDSRNGVPTDSQGRPIRIGSMAEGEIVIEPKKVQLDGKVWSLGPKVSRICGKIVIVGLDKSYIQCKEGTKGVDNGKITIIA